MLRICKTNNSTVTKNRVHSYLSLNVQVCTKNSSALSWGNRWSLVVTVLSDVTLNSTFDYFILDVFGTLSVSNAGRKWGNLIDGRVWGQTIFKDRNVRLFNCDVIAMFTSISLHLLIQRYNIRLNSHAYWCGTQIVLKGCRIL